MVHPIGFGTREIVNAQTQQVAGYVFVDERAEAASLSEQRWVLYDNFSPPPVGVMLLRAPELPRLRMKTRSEWEKALLEGDLWRRDARYVKVNAVAYPELITVATPPDRMLDEGLSKVAVGDRQHGMLYTTTTARGDVSIEHWVIDGDFAPSASATLMVGGTSSQASSPTLAEFLAQAKLEWRAGSTYVVAVSTSFEHLPSAL